MLLSENQLFLSNLVALSRERDDALFMIFWCLYKFCYTYQSYYYYFENNFSRSFLD